MSLYFQLTHSLTLCKLTNTVLTRHKAFDFQRYTTTWKLVESIVFAGVALINAVHAIQGSWRQRANESSKSVETTA
jgi:hypothetical protein